MSGHIFAFVTATAVDFHGEDDYTERHGWIDTNWSMTELMESRNDANAIVDCDESDAETLSDEISEALEMVYPYEDNGDGTFYGQSETTDESGTVWTYAVHFIRKAYGYNGWTETAVRPVKCSRCGLWVLAATDGVCTPCTLKRQTLTGKRHRSGMIGYAANWHGGHSYGMSHDFRDDAEFFASISDAESEFYSRYSGGISVSEPIRFSDDGTISEIGESETVYTPAVDESSFMDLHVIYRADDGEYVYGEEIAYRLTFGPRMGIKRERG